MTLTLGRSQAQMQVINPSDIHGTNDTSDPVREPFTRAVWLFVSGGRSIYFSDSVAASEEISLTARCLFVMGDKGIGQIEAGA